MTLNFFNKGSDSADGSSTQDASGSTSSGNSYVKYVNLGEEDQMVSPFKSVALLLLKSYSLQMKGYTSFLGNPRLPSIDFVDNSYLVFYRHNCRHSADGLSLVPGMVFELHSHKVSLRSC